MALTAMYDYVDGVTELKALCGYGLPKTYPLAVNGMFGMGALACGGSCACAKCRGISGLGDVDFSGIGAYKDAQGNILIGPAQQGQEVSQEEIDKYNAAKSKGAGPAVPPTEFAQKANVITDSIAKLAAAFAPAFKKEPRQKVIVEKQPDYTTYAVIGGAVIVSSVLAIAVGKSGR